MVARRADTRRRRAALLHARPAELLARRSGDRRPRARARARRDARPRPEQRGDPAALLRAGLAVDEGVRQRRGGHPVAVGAVRHRDHPGRVVGRASARVAGGGAGGRRARSGQPLHGLVLAGGARVRAAGAAVRGIARVLRRGHAPAGRPLARVVGLGVGTRAPDPLLRDLRRGPRGRHPAVAPARAPAGGRGGYRRRRSRRGRADTAGRAPGRSRARRLDRADLARHPDQGHR